MTFKVLTMCSVLAVAPTLAHGQSGDVWKVGEIAALTGPAATVGIRLNSVSAMWAAEVNEKGGGLPDLVIDSIHKGKEVTGG